MTNVIEILIKASGGDQAGREVEKAKSGLTGMNDALKELTGVSIGTAAGIGAFVAGLKFSISEAAAAERVTAQLNAVIKSTGQAAGFSADDIDQMANQLSRLTGVEDDAIKRADALLLTFTNIKGEVFQGATVAALNLSAALGQDLQSSIMQVGKALNDPIQGIGALKRVGVSFTEDQKNMADALVKSGKTMEAQKMILAELDKEFGGAAEAMGDTFTGKVDKAKNSIGNLAEVIGSKLLPPLGRAADGLTMLINYSGDVQAMLDAQKEAAVKAGMAYEEYATKQAGAMLAAGRISKATYDGIIATIKDSNTVDAATAKYGELTDAKIAELIATRQITQNEGELLALRAGALQSVGILTSAEYKAAVAAEKEKAYNDSLADSVASVDNATRRAAGGLRDFGGAVNEAGYSVEAQNSFLTEYNTTLADVASATADVQAAEQQFSEALGSQVVGALDSAGISGQKLYSALSEVDYVLGTNFQSAQKQKDAITDLVKAYAQTGDMDAFKRGLEGIKKTFGAQDEGIQTSMKKLDELQAKLLELQSRAIYVDIFYREFGKPDFVVSGGPSPNAQTQSGKTKGYASGGDFWVSTPTNILVGEGGQPEHVQITPASQVSSTAATITITQIFNGPAEPTVVRAASEDGVLKAMQARGKA